MTAEKCTVCASYAKDGICRTCSQPCDDCECTEFYRDPDRKPPAKKKAAKAPAPEPPAGIGQDFDEEGRLVVRASRLLAKTTSIIVTGNVPEVMQLPEAGEEQRKKITSTLLSGQELIMWDESHVIAGHTLAAILTAERYSDRLLGGNKMMSAVNRFTMISLGNNVQVRGDMKRRVWPCRLVPDTAHPEHRTGFRHPDLDGWVQEHRGELLGAVLVIWRNWIAKGRPEASITLGSFERWGRAVGGALEAAGITGFGASTAEWFSYSEDDDGGWTEHLAQLRRRFDSRWFTVSDVADAVGAMLLKRPPVKHDPDKELAVQLAYAYRGQREKWHGDLRLVRSAERDGETGSYTWTVRQRTDQIRAEDLQDVQYLQPGDETTGQSPITGHPEDTEDGYLPSDALTRWPEGTIGGEANSAA